jgi:uncharacterized repeat protein (TIGR01451 family)
MSKKLNQTSSFKSLLFGALAVGSINIAHAIGDTLSVGSRVGDQHSYAATTWTSFSADGRYLALTATANYLGTVFIYDRMNNTATNIMPTATGGGTVPTLSADARYVAFRSSATNLISNDVNGVTTDIFVYDRQNQTFELISKSSQGVQGNDLSYFPAISADGNVVAFSSAASNLVSNDSNGYADIFVRNRKLGKTTRVSVSSTGTEGNMGIGATGTLDISADGRYVVFSSPSSNLASNDTNTTEDIFLHDTKTATTTAVSVIVRDTATSVSGKSSQPSISADGRFIAFQSGSSKLVATDTDDFFADIFVYDRLTKLNSKITLNANGQSVLPHISADGRYVIFLSQASNLVANDTNNAWDTFRYDRKTGKTSRINVTATGLQSSGDASPAYVARPSSSADGRFISFETGAKDVTPDDTDSAMTDVFLRDTMANNTKNANVGITINAPSTSLQGQQYTYTATVTNAGAATAAQTNVIMQLPSALGIVSVKPSQGSCVKSVISVCSLGAIANGGQATIQITVTGLKKGNALFSATAQSGEVDTDMNNNIATHNIVIN